MNPKVLQNIIGRQIAKYRYAQSWSQSRLAVQCQLKGFDISRECVAKIETGIHYVEDYALLYFARIFNVTPNELYPSLDATMNLHDNVEKLLHRNGFANQKNVQKSEQPKRRRRGKR